MWYNQSYHPPISRRHNSGAAAFGARPSVVQSMVVDGEIGDSIFGTIYPTISGFKHGAEIDIILPEELAITAEGLLHSLV